MVVRSVSLPRYIAPSSIVAAVVVRILIRLHGGNLAPDFEAMVGHDWALDLAGRLMQAQFGKPRESLGETERAAIDAQVGALLNANRYVAATGILTLPAGGVQMFADQTAR